VREREAEKIPRQKIYSILRNAGLVKRRWRRHYAVINTSRARHRHVIDTSWFHYQSSWLSRDPSACWEIPLQTYLKDYTASGCGSPANE
jgi:hypothetical protein